MSCRNCGFDNADGSLFCERCGATFARAQDPLGGALSSPSGFFRTLTPSPSSSSSPSLPRSLTAEFRSFPLDSPYLAVPTPGRVERFEFDGVSASPLGEPRRRPPKTEEPLEGGEQSFSTLRPSEALWILDGVITHLFEEELATVPDRRFLHVKLMEGEDELYYHPLTADYWDRLESILAKPGTGRRISIFHRPTDIVPGFPFMNFGVELELGDGAGEDAPMDSVRVAFRMKHYYSGREEELREAFRYTKPLQLAMSVFHELSTRVGRSVPPASSLIQVLEMLAAGKADLLDRVLGRLAELRSTSENQRVALATELYGMILGLRLEAEQTRVMVADDLAFLSSLVQTVRDDAPDREPYFGYKRVTPRMGILLRSHQGQSAT